MGWVIRYSKTADKKLRKLDSQIAASIIDTLDDIAAIGDPRSCGKPLQHKLAGLWRYRIGDYRAICLIEDEVMLVLVVDVAHRRDVYRRYR